MYRRAISSVWGLLTAKEYAKNLVDGHGAELWQGKRKISAFRHSTEVWRIYFFFPDPKFGCQPAAAPF
jgi:hypothetical protein